MRVLVTGGAGYIGSVVTEELTGHGHEAVVYDNLSKGHAGAVGHETPLVRAELADRGALCHVLSHYKIEAVIHMAADSLVGESYSDPQRYYRNNVSAGLSLLDAMKECGVARLVFSSTAAVYGDREKQPIDETDPVYPTNPYGETKLALERALQWYGEAYGLRHASLRYFNAAGASRRRGEWHHPETHLIPLVLEAAAGRRGFVEVYGEDYPTPDGTCVRDYIHVVDLARAHVLALGLLDHRSATYNLGCGGNGYSVLQVIETARAVTGREIPFRFGPRRPGDPAVLVASSDKIRRELGWDPQFQQLDAMIGSAWIWLQDHPFGYDSMRG
jgi:UDP-glucose 4-epimerase